MLNIETLEQAQEAYDRVTAKVDSVKRKLDNASSAVTYDTLSPLLDEQKRCKEQLDEATELVAQTTSKPRSRVERDVAEGRRVKEERRLAGEPSAAIPTQT